MPETLLVYPHTLRVHFPSQKKRSYIIWSSGLFRPLGKLLPAPLMSLQRGQPLNKKLFTFVNTSEKDTYRAGATDGLEPVPSRWSLVPTSNPSLLSYPSVQYLARRDTPPLPVAPIRGAHFAQNSLTKGKLNTVFRYPLGFRCENGTLLDYGWGLAYERG